MKIAILAVIAFSVLLLVPLGYQSALAGTGIGASDSPSTNQATNDYETDDTGNGMADEVVVDDGNGGELPVTFDPSMGAWQKNFDVNNIPNVPPDTAPPLYVIPVKEILTPATGTVEWTDWHEEILEPGWGYDTANFNVLIDGQPPSPSTRVSISFDTSPNNAVSDNIFWMDFDPPLAPGEIITIDKYMICKFPQQNCPLPILVEQFPTSFIDFGDLEDPSYPTLLSSDGARHRIVTSGPLFGTAIDPEADGQPIPHALGDDMDGSADEDGITFVTILPGAGLVSHVSVVVTGGPAVLNAWIDFDDNGVLTDTHVGPIPEQIAINTPVVSGVNNILFSTPGFVTSNDELSSRFRISTSTTDAITPTGLANDGEVQDYSFIFTSMPDPPSPVGGTGIPISTTSLLLAGMQSNYSVLMALTVVGIGAFGFLFYSTKKKSEEITE